MKIKEAIKKDKKRIKRNRKESMIRKLKIKEFKNCKVTLTKKKTCVAKGYLFVKDVPSVVDGCLAKYLKMTGFFKVEGVE